MRKILLLFLLSVSLFGQVCLAQTQIQGIITDAETGEPLPSAHIIIKNTYQGTISNQDGEFNLNVPSVPVTLVARFIGFESQEIIVHSAEEKIHFKMKPSVAELGEILVTGEDPAIEIMREVIRKKQIWRKNLETYKAEAYSRQQLNNDTAIVMISESVSTAFWDREKGPREVLKSKRQTANMEAADNFAGVSYLPNFYDDNIEIAGFDLVGVTHPKALSYYNFYLEDMQSIDDNVVYELSVTSKRKLQPLFEGTIYVLGEEYALLEVDLKPNSVVAFPPPVQDFNLTYSQQYSNFGGDYWLPVDVRIEGVIEIGLVGLRFPAIGFKQVARLSNYEVNVPLPDSLYESNDTFSVDSVSVAKSDSIFVQKVDVIPLNTDEKQAYETLDSTATIEKAFRPEGFFTRFIDWEEESESGNSGGTTGSSGSGAYSKITRNLSPQARFNRVELFYGGLKHERNYLGNKLFSRTFVGYNTGYNEFSYGLTLGWRLLKNSRRLMLFSGYNTDTETRYNSDLYPQLVTSSPVLFGFDDYFDYYRRDRLLTGIVFTPQNGMGSIDLRYKYEIHSEIDEVSSYDLAGRNYIQRPNSYVDEGTLSAVRIKLSKGNESEALGAVGADDYSATIEQSASFLGSDWDYTRFKIDIYRRFETFYQRRFFPNTLDLRLNAGTYLGNLPIQKNEVLDASLGLFTPFGAFKTKRFLPYEGASYFALNAEHNFKSIPFEILGWRDATKSGLSLLVFGGIGKTWVQQDQVNQFQNRYGFNPQTTDNLHMEAGVSLSNIFNLFRADVAYRIDKPGFFLGVSVARLF
jgi:hypothetical protein